VVSRKRKKGYTASMALNSLKMKSKWNTRYASLNILGRYTYITCIRKWVEQRI
jgi:hypothetical protein